MLAEESGYMRTNVAWLIAYVHKSSDFYNWYKKYDGEYKKSLHFS